MPDFVDLISVDFESHSGRREMPTRAMLDAGNYKKKHVRFAEMNITIENPKGSIRSGVGDGGKPWSVKMNNDYGYIKRSVGADGENVDCFLGPNENAGHVYVVHQKKPKTGEYDEDKCMIGFDSEAEAKSAYLSNYSSPDFLGPISTMPVEQFKKMCAYGTNGQIVKWNNKHASKAVDFVATGFDFEVGKFGDQGRYVTIDHHVVFIADNAGFVPHHLKDESTGYKRFSRSALERKLIEHHEEYGGSTSHHDEVELASTHAGGSPFVFRGVKGKLPEEIANSIGKNSALRRLIRLAKDGEVSGGEDAMGHLGFEKYLDIAERMSEGKLTAAKSHAALSPDPEIQFLNSIHDNLPNKRASGTLGDTVPIKAGELRVGSKFTIHGHHFVVVADEHGHRVLQGGIDWPDTPIDALSTIPVDQGSFRQGRKVREEIPFNGDYIAFAHEQGGLFTGPAHKQSELFSNQDGVWRTINGVHVMIRDGKITKGPHNLEGKSLSEAWASKQKSVGDGNHQSIEADAKKNLRPIDRKLNEGGFHKKEDLVSGSNEHRTMMNRRLKELADAGHIQRAYDDQGNPHIARTGEPMPAHLKTEEQMNAVQSAVPDAKAKAAGLPEDSHELNASGVAGKYPQKTTFGDLKKTARDRGHSVVKRSYGTDENGKPNGTGSQIEVLQKAVKYDGSPYAKRLQVYPLNDEAKPVQSSAVQAELEKHSSIKPNLFGQPTIEKMGSKTESMFGDNKLAVSNLSKEDQRIANQYDPKSTPFLPSFAKPRIGEVREASPTFEPSRVKKPFRADLDMTDLMGGTSGPGSSFKGDFIDFASGEK